MRSKKTAITIAVVALALWAYAMLKPGGEITTGHDAFLAAEAFLVASSYDDAIKSYRLAMLGVLEEKEKEAAYFGIAVALQKSGKLADAVTAYEEAIRRYPQSTRANKAQEEIERIGMGLQRKPTC